MTPDFEDQLMALINEHQQRYGTSNDEMIAAMELRIMALKEEQAE